MVAPLNCFNHTQNLAEMKSSLLDHRQDQEFVDAVKTHLSASNSHDEIQRMFTVNLANNSLYQGGFEIQQNANGACYIPQHPPGEERPEI